MLQDDAHLSDEDLLMAADGEFASAHLARCGECRTRMEKLQSTVADCVRAYKHELDPQVPPLAGPRALLLARLADSSRRRWWPRLALAAAGFGVVMLVSYQWRMIAEFEPGVAPKRNLTPGATLAVTASEVCAADFAQSIPVIPESVQQKVFEAYGIANPRLDAYEVDYLITPELGGATTIRNLWPEPYHAPVWNAHVKDDLENRLHRMVCSGELELATAQRDIAANWIAAYKKYFRSDRPVAVRMPAGPDLRIVLARF
ncbi:MAG TPA: hypothetical protein VK604_02840 [Bryobacteraceae bacterium]|nr:hypothetical protein [Bryobacteraceae bacterium]